MPASVENTPGGLRVERGALPQDLRYPNARGPSYGTSVRTFCVLLNWYLRDLALWLRGLQVLRSRGFQDLTASPSALGALSLRIPEHVVLRFR